MSSLNAKHLVAPALKPTIAYVLVSAAVLAATWLVAEPRLRVSTQAEVSERMRYQAVNRAEVLERRKSRLHDDALFLSQVPPVQGVVRAIQGGGRDREEDTPLRNWRSRLERIFLAYAQTNPEISQLRFIGVADGGREIVRVDRRGDSVMVVPEGRLHRKGDRPHFQATLALRDGLVHFSGVDVKREPGWDSFPILRTGTPVRDPRGRVFGAIVVNIDARPMLQDFRIGLPPPFQPILLDAEGRILSHPDRRQESSLPARRERRWKEVYASMPPDDSSPRWVRQIAPPAGSLLVSAQRIPLDDYPSRRTWTVCVVYPDSALSARTSGALWTMLQTMGIALALLGVFLHLSMVGARRQVAYANERARLGAIVDGSQDAIVGKDLDGPVNSWNRAAEAMFGIPPERALGKRLRELLFPGGGGELLDDLRTRLLQGETTPSGILEWEGTDRRRTLHVSLSPVRAPEGGVTGFATTIRDITSQEQARKRIVELNSNLENQVQERTRELRLMTDEALAAARAKAEFLANMSHEIRTPMTAVMGLAQLVEQKTREEGTRDLIRKIRRAGATLQSLLDDILDFSKIEAGRLELERETFRLEDVLSNLATIMSSNAGAKDIDLAIGAPPPEAAWLVGDSHRLEQILINLTGNAIKFTEKGSVVVRIESLSNSQGRVVLGFAVKDTGIGIPEDKIPNLFDAFTQADASTTRRFGGTGLGLAICRLLVEKMDGTIEVRSRPGEGSEFRFTAAFGIAPPPPPASHADFDVLVADDVEESRQAIASVAESLGWHALEVDDGEKALSAILEHTAKGKPFDIILLDWKMPGLDGMATARELRARLDSQPPPILILATAHGREALASSPEASLVDEILAKPVTGSNLYDAVTQALKRRHGTRIDRTPLDFHRTRLLEGMRFLVVDDNEANRDLLHTILEDAGASVALAKDGREAVDWVRSHKREVDAVLMDLQMPGMDGYTATREIRTDRDLRDLRVVALSAGVFPSEREAAKAAGMDGFIPKPFLIEDLLLALAQLSGSATSDSKGVSSAPETAPEDLAAKDVVDHRRGISLWRTEDAFHERLVRFASSNAGFVREIETLVATGSWDAACASLHRFRGAAGAVALLRLVDVTKELETELRRHPETPPSLERLRLEVDSAFRTIARIPVAPAPDTKPQAIATPPEPPPELPRLLEELGEALRSDNRKRSLEALERLGGVSSPHLDEIRRRILGYGFQAALESLDLFAREWKEPRNQEPIS